MSNSSKPELKSTVLVHGPNGPQTFQPGDELPDWAVEAIKRDDVWDEDGQAGPSGAPVVPTKGENSEDDLAPDSAIIAPAGNASLEDWQRHAAALGMDPEEVEGKTRNELRDMLAPTEES